jgi:hypothetical protein
MITKSAAVLVAFATLAVPLRAAAQEPEPKEAEPSWTVPTLHALGLMTTMRIGEAVIWPDPFADTSPSRIGRSYRDTFTMPPRWDSSRSAFEWDGDRWYINVIGHGLFGSELYLRARTCHNGVLAAFAFTAIGSTLWEYGFEGNAVRPSALDLAYTPVAGVVLGETRFLVWTAARKLRDPALRGVLSAVVDPLGEIERAFRTPC